MSLVIYKNWITLESRSPGLSEYTGLLCPYDCEDSCFRERALFRVQNEEEYDYIIFIVFKLSPCFSNDKLSSGYFNGVWVLQADVSEFCVGSIFNRW
jgi:hypothetical protein